MLMRFATLLALGAVGAEAADFYMCSSSFTSSTTVQLDGNGKFSGTCYMLPGTTYYYKYTLGGTFDLYKDSDSCTAKKSLSTTRLTKDVCTEVMPQGDEGSIKVGMVDFYCWPNKNCGVCGGKKMADCTGDDRCSWNPVSGCEDKCSTYSTSECKANLDVCADNGLVCLGNPGGKAPAPGAVGAEAADFYMCSSSFTSSTTVQLDGNGKFSGACYKLPGTTYFYTYALGGKFNLYKDSDSCTAKKSLSTTTLVADVCTEVMPQGDAGSIKVGMVEVNCWPNKNCGVCGGKKMADCTGDDRCSWNPVSGCEDKCSTYSASLCQANLDVCADNGLACLGKAVGKASAMSCYIFIGGCLGLSLLIAVCVGLCVYCCVSKKQTVVVTQGGPGAPPMGGQYGYGDDKQM